MVTYETIIDVDNPEQKLFPGMTADVAILAARKTGVVKVSNVALRYTPPDGAVFGHTPPAKLDRRQRLVYVVGARTNPRTTRPARRPDGRDRHGSGRGAARGRSGGHFHGRGRRQTLAVRATGRPMSAAPSPAPVVQFR